MRADKTNELKVWQGLVLAILFILLLPAILLWVLVRFLAQTSVLLAVWMWWLPRGRDTLVVYSMSPHWKEYFEADLIPLIERRSLILNWSDRSKWSTLDLRVLAFRAFAGEHSFNPMVISFKPFRWPERFRFFEPFKEYKHGKDQPLQQLEEYLGRRLGVSIPLIIS